MNKNIIQALFYIYKRKKDLSLVREFSMSRIVHLKSGFSFDVANSSASFERCVISVVQ